MGVWRRGRILLVFSRESRCDFNAHDDSGGKAWREKCPHGGGLNMIQTETGREAEKTHPQGEAIHQ